MTYVIGVKSVPEQPILVIRERTRREDLSLTIGRLLDGVYEFARQELPRGVGLNVVQYFDWGAEFVIEVGVIVPIGTPGAGNIRLSATPAGRVATTTHWGTYDGLTAAHSALLAWCREHDLEPTGRNWEIYGHWNEDPAERRTDIFHQLKEGPA
jgi:effector-binding domain-containing protein